MNINRINQVIITEGVSDDTTERTIDCATCEYNVGCPTRAKAMAELVIPTVKDCKQACIVKRKAFESYAMDGAGVQTIMNVDEKRATMRVDISPTFDNPPPTDQ